MFLTKGMRRGFRSLFSREGKPPVSGETGVATHWAECASLELDGIAFPYPGETYAQMVKRCADEKSSLGILDTPTMRASFDNFGVKLK